MNTADTIAYARNLAVEGQTQEAIEALCEALTRTHDAVGTHIAWSRTELGFRKMSTLLTKLDGEN